MSTSKQLIVSIISFVTVVLSINNSFTIPKPISPSPHEAVSTSTINIRSMIDNGEKASYFATFNVTDYICTKPRLTIYFQDTDFDGNDGIEFLNIYYDGLFIQSCGNNNMACGDFKFCLQNYSLPNVATVLPGTNITIQLQKGKDSGIPMSCNYSLWADVTLSCDKSCTDYNPMIDSKQGTMESSFNTSSLDTSQYISNINNVYFKSNSILQSYWGSTIDCIGNINCIIECDFYAGCASTNIKVYTNKSLVLSCKESWACRESKVTSTLTSKNASYFIVCNATQSCRDMQIFVSNFSSFSIYCNDPYSCQGMAIALNTISSYNQSENNDRGKIYCVSQNSCAHLQIKTNSEYTQLFMYEHSNNITFDNGIGYIPDQNIICNQDKYIVYRSWIETNNITLIDEQTRNEYTGSNYPCEDITVKCDKDYECNIKYTIRESAIAAISNTSDEQCFFIHVPTIQDITCPGECIAVGTRQPTSEPTHPTSDPTEQTLIPTYSPSKSPSTSAQYINCRDSTCNSQTKTCPDNADCTIDCAYFVDENTEGCQWAVLNCPSNAKCTILCDNKEACEVVTVNATASTELHINCSDYPESCRWMDIYCPLSTAHQQSPVCLIHGDNQIYDGMLYN